MEAPVPARCRVNAWDPGLPLVAEVFHASISGWAYPAHCHDTWAVLIVDAGAIRYDLDSRRCRADRGTVAILPPGVVHDGRPAPGAPGFRKRELYLRPGFLPGDLVGAAVDRTSIADGAVRAALAGVHDCLVAGEGLDAEGRLALVAERIEEHLAPARRRPAARPERRLAFRLRELLDARARDPISLAEAAALLDRSVPHLIRSFTGQFGVSPHAYVIGRRVDAARRELLSGVRPADVAVTVGFHDQAHLNRQFKRHTGVTPAAFARSHARIA